MEKNMTYWHKCQIYSNKSNTPQNRIAYVSKLRAAHIGLGIPTLYACPKTSTLKQSTGFVSLTGQGLKNLSLHKQKSTAYTPKLGV